MDLANRIATWRKFRGLSHRELATAVGVSPAAVYQWEGCGESKTTPSIPHLESLVEALGLTMERFYGRLPKLKGREGVMTSPLAILAPRCREVAAAPRVRRGSIYLLRAGAPC